MPGPQGVMHWPNGAPNISVLTEETLWPIETGHIDRLVLLHGLETSERPAAILDECWRVLGPGGKILVIVPNRGGLWSRRDRTPYGFGRPYSLSQLETQMKAHQFLPERHMSALYQIPSERRFWLKSARVFERFGSRLPMLLAGGALMVEASKRVQAPKGTVSRVRKRAKVPKGLAEPVVGMSGDV